MTVLLVEAVAGELILPRLTACSVCSVYSGTSASVLAGVVASSKQTNHLHTQQRKQDGEPTRAPAEPSAFPHHHQCGETQRGRHGHEQVLAGNQHPKHERRACRSNVQELPVQRPLPS